MNVLVGRLPGLVLVLAELHVELVDLALHQGLLVDGWDVDPLDFLLEVLELLGDLAQLEVSLLLVNEFVSHSLLLRLLLIPLLLHPFELQLQLLNPVLRILDHLLLHLLEEAKSEGTPSQTGCLGL